ncbi:MAG TPA: phosphate ABC transporter substrate-binding protein PstS [Kofleriaceae bacterium]|nr:phosphate ABC transporter substrate-binding protein PstS [Kofleriaceae bacterium]
MKRSGSIQLAAAVAVALASPGCKTSEAPPGGGGAGKVTINGSGATFQKAAQEIAIEAFAKVRKDITVNYAGGGSGKGRKELADQVVDYACTDAPYKAEEAASVKGGAFFYIPNVLGAIAVSYHLGGVDKLQLSADTLAKIFQREIKQWDDPAILADNPGAKLPSAAIVVARRADGSGTTENFTRYLHEAGGGAWKLGSGSTVAWPGDTQAGNGNNGVAGIVKKTSGAIGYLDLSDAIENKLRYAAVKNQAGTYVTPDAASVTAAAEGITPDDKLLFSALNGKGVAAYPLTAQSWCMVYEKQTDKAKGEALSAWFKFLLTDGQKLLPEIDFAPVPKALADKALAQIEKIQVP